MTEVSQPTHNRLISVLKAIGPYLREEKCELDYYFFDCLAVCVDDEKSPEKREFWGWWLQLEKQEQNFIANYQFGLYDDKGKWRDVAIPAAAKVEVEKTLETFHQKLDSVLSEQYQFAISSHAESAKEL
ncbi:MAG: sigma factor-binding protein Crl [Vibrio sp.]